MRLMVERPGRKGGLDAPARARQSRGFPGLEGGVE